ncbi:glucose-6-phosphate dehydrogenase, partial [candidate division KSB1 bacterium]|nr:glucose-6-phosphate dehydrogenase [candidate division KSB1 bacterium]
ETVQNLLVLRFANGIYEPLWNRNYIDHVEVTSAEDIGVGSRGGYYEGAGALRDMFQNHLLHVVGMIAMEPPSSFSAHSVRNETLKVFESLRKISPKEIEKYVVRGQYVSSKIRGEKVPGYRDAEGVDPQSKTETFVAVKFFIDNWRWG